MKQYQEIVLQAMKDKSPELHKALKASGDLQEYVDDLVGTISSGINQAVQQARMEKGWDKDPATVEVNLKMARVMYEELVLQDLLEFPTDD